MLIVFNPQCYLLGCFCNDKSEREVRVRSVYLRVILFSLSKRGGKVGQPPIFCYLFKENCRDVEIDLHFILEITEQNRNGVTLI